jgi:hypothetical protein
VTDSISSEDLLLLGDTVSHMDSLKAAPAVSRNSETSYLFDDSGQLVPLSVAESWPGHYSLNEAQFKSELKKHQDDLGFQLRNFRQMALGIDGQLSSVSPPYYPHRVLVILRKAKQFYWERRFLAAYFRLFWSPRGSLKNFEMGVRALKLGIDIPHPPSCQPHDHVALSKKHSIENLDVFARPTGESTCSVGFRCLMCAGKVLDVDDQVPQPFPVRCKSCRAYFGTWDDVQKYAKAVVEHTLETRAMMYQGQ